MLPARHDDVYKSIAKNRYDFYKTMCTFINKTCLRKSVEALVTEGKNNKQWIEWKFFLKLVFK